MKLPEPFLTRMRQMLGDEYEAFLNSYDQPAARGSRPESAQGRSPDLELPFPTAPVEWCPTGRRYDGNCVPVSTPGMMPGSTIFRSPSAMAVAEIAAPQPGERVLDLWCRSRRQDQPSGLPCRRWLPCSSPMRFTPSVPESSPGMWSAWASAMPLC